MQANLQGLWEVEGSNHGLEYECEEAEFIMWALLSIIDEHKNYINPGWS